MDFTVRDFVAATFTPLTNTGEINLKEIDSYQKFLYQQGVRHVYVNGSTGEGPSLTVQERKDLTEEWIKQCQTPERHMKVMVQVGGTNIKDTLELAEHAKQVGADAISSLPPLYFTPACLDDLVEFCRQVAEKASGIPLYYYHIPMRTGVTFPMNEFLEKSTGIVKTLRGIKFSSKDLFEASLCLKVADVNGKKYDMLFGCDEQVLTAMAIGFQGAVGSTYNLMAPVYHKMWEALQAGDMETAREQQRKSADFVDALFKFGGVTGGILPAQKACLEELGVNIGPPRFPLSRLDDKSHAALVASMQSLGFFEWQKK